MRYKSTVFSLTVLTLFACSKQPEPQLTEEVARPAKIFIARKSSASAKRVYPGTVEASNKSDLSFRVGGQLKRLVAKPGMTFSSGDVLAELDDAEYVNLVADRQAKYDLAKSQNTKIAKLYEQKYVSQAQVDESEASLKAAQAALLTAQDNLTYTKLLAPFDGVAALVHGENHQSIQPNKPLIEYHNRDLLDIRFGVPESLMGEIKPVEDPSSFCADVRFNAYPNNSYQACFKEFESVPDQVTRSYSAVYSMPTITDFPALPGMAVSVELDLTEMLHDSVVMGAYVPIEAVFQKAGKARVWQVLEDSRVSEVDVVTGAIKDGFIFIQSGIQAGDAVVSAGVSYLEEGMMVKPMTKERGL